MLVREANRLATTAASAIPSAAHKKVLSQLGCRERPAARRPSCGRLLRFFRSAIGCDRRAFLLDILCQCDLTIRALNAGAGFFQSEKPFLHHKDPALALRALISVSDSLSKCVSRKQYRFSAQHSDTLDQFIGCVNSVKVKASPAARPVAGRRADSC